MLKMMALREFKLSYVGSAFGILWAVMNPLFQVAIYGVIFGLFFKAKPDPVYGTDNYLLFLLCGLVPWQFFAQTITTSSTSIRSNSNLIKKAVGFPSEVLPIVTVISNLISHLISLTLLLVLVVVLSGQLSVVVPFIFVYLFFTSIFAVGIGWILSSTNVFLKDIEQILSVAIMGWFFSTPVVYSPGIVPSKLLVFLKINPLYYMVEGYRLALLSGRLLPLHDIIYLGGISFLTLAAGGVFYRKLKPWFAEVL
jgi:ABC-type polysaccharide/polyol phosphate export permease